MYSTRTLEYMDVPHKAGSLKMNTALEYSTRVVQEGGRRSSRLTTGVSDTGGKFTTGVVDTGGKQWE